MNLFRFFVFFCLFFNHLVFSNVEIEQKEHYGLGQFTSERLEKIKKECQKVVDVKPSKLGAHRIKEHLKKKGLESPKVDPVSYDQEFLNKPFNVVQSVDKFVSTQSQLTSNLPLSVDNSRLICFPPIGDQGNLGSCVAFSTTYYLATHELGLLNGYNNKLSNQHILSPKWTYNLLNDGQDGGLYPDDAFDLLHVNGAATWNDFPYDSNYLSWDLDREDWIAATYNRLTEKVIIPGLGGSSGQNLTAIKSALNNGHILTFCTFVDSWIYTRIKNDPTGLNNNHVGELAAVYMNGYSGGHCMTIVGYDDTLWIDVNNNGNVDANERGAFLVANSWGTSWGNNGFVWVSYDAFRSISAVSRGPALNRVPLGDAMDSYVIMAVPVANNYTPKLLGQFSLTQALRNQISITAGVSGTMTTSPSMTWTIPGLVNQGGSYNFDGSRNTTPGTVSFVVDLTDQVPLNDIVQRYYLIFGDNQSGNVTTINQFALLDLVNHKIIADQNVPVTVDNSTVKKFLDYDFLNQSSPTISPPVATITSIASDAVVSGNLNVTASIIASGGIQSVDLYIDDVYISSDSTAPYQFFVDTTLLSNGTHSITIKVTDQLDQKARDDVLVNVNNPPVFTINVPKTNAQVFGTVTISATVSPNTPINSMRFSCDGKDLNEDFSAPYQFSLDTTQLTNGTHTIALTGINSLGSSTKSVQIIVNNNKVFSPIFINAGGSTVVFQGTTWIQDNGLFSGKSSMETVNLLGVNPIYNSLREGNLIYQFQVPNGNYKVSLKFLENTYRSRNQRLFNVFINDVKVLSNFDIFKIKGFRAPCDQSFNIKVTNEKILLQLVSVKNSASICGIAITKN
jgi:C1A family cysteine protease